MTIKWEGERDRELTEMYMAGYSYTDIAVKLLSDASKIGAIAGRIKRLKLSRPGNVIRPPASGSRSIPKRRPIDQPIDRPIVEPTERIAIENIRYGMCRWPLGDPHDAHTFCFCGVTPLGRKKYSDKSSPYCAKHTAIAFYPPGRRE